MLGVPERDGIVYTYINNIYHLCPVRFHSPLILLTVSPSLSSIVQIFVHSLILSSLINDALFNKRREKSTQKRKGKEKEKWFGLHAALN